MSIISLERLSSSLPRYYTMSIISLERLSSYILRYYHVHHFSWEVVFFSSQTHLWLGRPLLLFPGTTMSIISLERLSSSLPRSYHVHHFSWEVVFFSSPVLPCPSFLLRGCLLLFPGTTMSIISLERLSSSLPRSYHVHHFSWEVVFFSSRYYHVHHFTWEVVFFSSPVLPCPSFHLRGCLLLFPGTTMSIISLERLSSSHLRYYHVHHFSWEVVFFSSPVLPCPSFLLRGCLLLFSDPSLIRSPPSSLPRYYHVHHFSWEVVFFSSQIHLWLGRPLLLFPGTTMSIISLERLSSYLLRYYHVHHFSWEVVFFSSPVLYHVHNFSWEVVFFFSSVLPCPSFLLKGCLLLFTGTTMSIISLERLSSSIPRYYHVHHFSWEVVFLYSPVLPCPSFLLRGCLLLFPGTTMSIISLERLSSSLPRYYHVHHFSWEVVFLYSPVLPCPSFLLRGCLLLFSDPSLIRSPPSSLPRYYHVHHFSWEVVFFSSSVLPCPSFLLRGCLLLFPGTTMSIISLERLSSSLPRSYHVHHFSWEVVFFSSPVLPCPSFLLRGCLLLFPGTTMSIISLERLSSSLPRYYHVHHFSWEVVFFSSPVLPCPSFLLRGCLLFFPGTTMSIISLERLSSSLPRYYHVHHFSWEVVFFSSPVLPCPSFLLRGCLLLFPGTTMSIISLERLSSSLLRYYHVHHFSWEVVFFSSPVLYHVHHFSWEVVFFSSPVLPCPSFLLRGCLLLFPGTTMSIVSLESLSSYILRYYHVHHFSWEVVFFSSPVLPCPSFLLRGCLLLFLGTTMSIISLERLSSSLPRYYHVHHFSWEVVFFSSRYYHVHHISWEVVFFSSPVLYHVHHFSWEVVFFSSPVLPCPSFLLRGCLLLFPGTTMSIISLVRLSSSLLRYDHVHHFSCEVVFFSSPVRPCPSFLLIGCLLLFPGTTMSIISLDRLSSSLPRYYHVHHFSCEVVFFSSPVLPCPSFLLRGCLLLFPGTIPCPSFLLRGCLLLFSDPSLIRSPPSSLPRYYHVHHFSWEVVFFSSPVLPCPSFLLRGCLLLFPGTTMSIISLERLSSSIPRYYHVHHFSWEVVFFSSPVLPCPSFLLRGCLLLFPGPTMSIISLERLSSSLPRYYHVHHFSWEVVFFSSPVLPCPSFLLRGCLLLISGTTMSIISLERLSSSLPRYYHVHHFSWEVVFFSSPVLPCPSFLLRGCLLLFPGTIPCPSFLLRGCLLLFPGTTMSIISLERLSSSLPRYYHVHRFSWEFVILYSPVLPCPSFLLRGCLLLFPGTTMSIISLERLSSSLPRYYHVHHFSWEVVFFSSSVLPCPSFLLRGCLLLFPVLPCPSYLLRGCLLLFPGTIPCPSFLLRGCLLLFPGTTMSIISLERLSSSLPRYYHVHHFSCEVVFFSSPVRPCPSFLLWGCLLLFPGTTMSIISLDRLSSSLPRYDHVHNFSW